MRWFCRIGFPVLARYYYLVIKSCRMEISNKKAQEKNTCARWQCQYVRCAPLSNYISLIHFTVYETVRLLNTIRFGIYYPLYPLIQIELSLWSDADMCQIIYPKNLAKHHSWNRLDIEGMNGVFYESLGLQIHSQIFSRASLEILSWYVEA